MDIFSLNDRLWQTAKADVESGGRNCEEGFAWEKTCWVHWTNVLKKLGTTFVEWQKIVMWMSPGVCLFVSQCFSRVWRFCLKHLSVESVSLPARWNGPAAWPVVVSPWAVGRRMAAWVPWWWCCPMKRASPPTWRRWGSFGGPSSRVGCHPVSRWGMPTGEWGLEPSQPWTSSKRWRRGGSWRLKKEHGGLMWV